MIGRDTMPVEVCFGEGSKVEDIGKLPLLSARLME